MFIIYGKRLYGAVDQVAGAFSIQTLFGHIYYLPLIPIESWLVFAGSTDKQWRGIKLESFAWRSILFAWGRLGLLLLAIFAGIGALGAVQETRQLVAALGIAALCIGALIWSYRASRASYERALALVREHGLGPQFEATIEASFGRAVSPATF
jgi:hypothetical protein